MHFDFGVFHSARIVRLFLVTGLGSAVDSGLDADSAKAALAAQGCREKGREGVVRGGD